MKLRGRTGTLTMGSLTHIKLMNTWWSKKLYAATTESRLLLYLETQEYRSKILFPYNFK